MGSRAKLRPKHAPFIEEPCVEPEGESRIPKSRRWYTCARMGMHACGKFCCCDAGFRYDAIAKACCPGDPIPGSEHWWTCSHYLNAQSCAERCYCKIGTVYDVESQACLEKEPIPGSDLWP